MLSTFFTEPLNVLFITTTKNSLSDSYNIWITLESACVSCFFSWPWAVFFLCVCHKFCLGVGHGVCRTTVDTQVHSTYAWKWAHPTSVGLSVCGGTSASHELSFFFFIYFALFLWLSWCMACGILGPWPGIETVSCTGRQILGVVPSPPCGSHRLPCICTVLEWGFLLLTQH